MKFHLILLLAASAFGAQPFAAGKEYYLAGEFRKAATYFQSACVTDNDAEACYWAGLAHEKMADISVPFGCRANHRAHDLLLKATQLNPKQLEYRRAFFEFLLNSADCSRTALREAAGMLVEMPESDPDYLEMSHRLEVEKRVKPSVEERLAKLILAAPRTI